MQEKTMQTSSATTVNTNIPKSYRTFLGVKRTNSQNSKDFFIVSCQ